MNRWTRGAAGAVLTIEVNWRSGFGWFTRVGCPGPPIITGDPNDMTHYTQADLAMAERHIAQGELHIVRQEELLTGLQARRHSTAAAEALLAMFNATLVEHRSHRDAIAVAIGTSRR